MIPKNWLLPEAIQKKFKNRSKGSFSHYQRKFCTKVIDQPVRPKDHPSCHPTDKPTHHRQCYGRARFLSLNQTVLPKASVMGVACSCVRMNFASNSVPGKSPKVVDSGLSLPTRRINSSLSSSRLIEPKGWRITPTGSRLGIVLQKLWKEEWERYKHTDTILKILSLKLEMFLSWKIFNWLNKIKIFNWLDKINIIELTKWKYSNDSTKWKYSSDSTKWIYSNDLTKWKYSNDSTK